MMGLMAGITRRAEANFVTYTETVVATGSLGGTAFTNALVTFTQTADTNDILHTTSSSYSLDALTSTVDVAGLGTASFTNPTLIGVQHAGTGSFAGLVEGTAAVGGPIIFAVNDVAFDTYDLKTSIGPIVGTPVYAPFTGFKTSLGLFVINLPANQTGGATFVANVALIPEPSSFVLSGIAIVSGLGYARSRRKTVPA